MKRAMFGRAAIVVLLCGAGVACSPSAVPSEKPEAPVAVGGWTRPPTIRAVQRVPGGLMFTGQAEPGARIVLRSESGPAHATVADDQGRFGLRIAASTGDLLLRPETQRGQDAAPSPERLLIVAGGRGPVAILRSGGATQRLDRAPSLGAVDSDGRMRLVSGRSAPGGPPVRLEAAGEVGEVTPDAAGRWSLVLEPSRGPDAIRVGDRSFTWPGEGAGLGGEDSVMRVERLEAGWRVFWRGPAGGRQTTWLPDAE